MTQPEKIIYGTPEQKARIAAIEPRVYEEGTFDDLIYRLGIAEQAEYYIEECRICGTEYADKRLPGFIKTLACRPIPEDELKEAVLKHVAYLRAQEKTINILDKLITNRASCEMSDKGTKDGNQ